MEIRGFILKTLALTLGVALSLCCLQLFNFIHFNYVNVVWGRVESVNYSKETDCDNVSVLYTVSEEPYAGTYRVVFQTKDFYNADELILLMTTKNYDRAKPFDEATFSGVDTKEVTSKATNTVVVVGKIVICLILACTLGYVVIWLLYRALRYARKYNRYENKLSNCSYVKYDEASSLYKSIDTILQSKRKCKNRTLIKMINKVLGQMYDRLDHICSMDRVTVKETEEDTKKLVIETINTFSKIASLITEQVYESVNDEYNSDDFKRALYQLEAYSEL